VGHSVHRTQDSVLPENYRLAKARASLNDICKGPLSRHRYRTYPFNAHCQGHLAQIGTHLLDLDLAHRLTLFIGPRLSRPHLEDAASFYSFRVGHCDLFVHCMASARIKGYSDHILRSPVNHFQFLKTWIV